MMKINDNFRPGKSMEWVVMAVLFLFFCSCSEEKKGKDEISQSLMSQIRELTEAGSLLLGTEQSVQGWQLFFETDTLEVEKGQIQQVEVNKSTWKSAIVFSEGTRLEVPALGGRIPVDPKDVRLNPSGMAPLSFVFTLGLPVESRVSIKVFGKHGALSDVFYLLPKYGYNHECVGHGLYADYKNTVEVCVTDKEGRVRTRDTFEIVTPPLSREVPRIQVVKSIPEKMEPGLTELSCMGESMMESARPMAIDAFGEIRWLLDFKSSPEFQRATSYIGMRPLRNGNYFMGDENEGIIYELDRLGNKLHAWSLKSKGYTFHHEAVERENGNFIVLATKEGNKHSNGKQSMWDFIVEIDREAGAVVKEWDLKDIMDEKRSVLNEDRVEENWAVANAIVYSETEDALTVSLRQQGVIKMDHDGRLKWILAPHKDWGVNKNGNNLSSYLLTPLHTTGEPVADRQVVEGVASANDFDWTWGQHCVSYLPDGNLMVFDNGFMRHYVADGETYSRAVIYHIDEAARTVKQVWDYGRERGADTYSGFLSSAVYLKNSDHVLIGSGCATVNVNGTGGQVIEVDRETKEVVFELHISQGNNFVFHRAYRTFVY